MPRIKLTPAFVLRAQAEPDDDRTIFWDETMPGFGLVVTAQGAKSYVVQYRVGRKSPRMKLKNVQSLAAARQQAKIVLGEVAKGRDPLAVRRQEQAAATNTLRAITTEYFKREGKELRSADERAATFERLVYPQLGAHQIADIRRKDIVRLLDRIEDERGPRMADITLAYLRRVFNWHAARDDNFRSPIVRGMARGKASARSRILTDEELRRVWQAAGAEGPFPAFVRFLLLTAARRNEAADLGWDEIDGRNWTLPAARNKTQLDLVRPLSGAALAVLAAQPRIAGCRWAFTASGKRPLISFSALKRNFDVACGVTGWTLHDLRRTARSLMSRAGVASDHAECCLGHVIGGVRRIYDRHEFYDEKARAFEALAAQIERIINPQENVVPLARPAS
jgi:integrase